MNHNHRDQGSDSDTCDPAGWNRASYTPDILAEIGEPLSDARNEYREAALRFVRMMFCIDEFATTASDARLGIIAVAVTLQWPSVRGLTVGDIVTQTGCTPAAFGPMPGRMATSWRRFERR
jgi:hypothetical protein